MQRQNRLSVGQQQRHPAGPVIGPLRIHHHVTTDIEKGNDLRQVLGRDVTASDQWRCSEGKPRPVATNRYESGSALLDDTFRILGDPARLQPGMGRAEGGVAGKRELAAGVKIRT